MTARKGTTAKRTTARRDTISPPAAKRTRKASTAKPQTSAPAAGRRAANKDATKRRIVAAALSLFASKGFDQTTTKAIANRAKVAEGTVFNYFETKEDIALHFFEEEVDHAIAVVRTRKSLQKATLEEKLFALVQQQIEFLAPHENFIGAAFVQALRPSSKLAFSLRALQLQQRYVAFVQELINEGLPAKKAKGVDNPLAWMAPQAFWIYYVGILLYWLHDSSPDKASTMAFLDRSLHIGVSVLRRGTIV